MKYSCLLLTSESGEKTAHIQFYVGLVQRFLQQPHKRGACGKRHQGPVTLLSIPPFLNVAAHSSVTWNPTIP